MFSARWQHSLLDKSHKRGWKKLYFFASLLSTRIPSAGLSAAHSQADLLLHWSLAAKWARLLITQLTAAYPTHQRTKHDEGWASLKQRKVVFKQNQTDSVRVKLCHPAHCVRMFLFQAGFLRSSFTSMRLVKWGRGVFFLN